MISAEVQNVFVGNEEVPTIEQFRHWISVFENDQKQEVGIRIVDAAEITQLNKTYREKDVPTNVLAFAVETPAGVTQNYIGDVIICAPVVTQQAVEQQKSVESHWAHLTLHGILHLQGYDHVVDADAEIMENLEVQLMAKLGYPNPYK